MLASPRASATLVLVLGLAACLAGCGRAAPDRAAEVAATAEAPPAAVPQRANATTDKALDQKKFGGAITEKTNTSLDALVREPERFASKTVRTEGKVSAVCEHKGCWMEIADDAGKAHIKMAGHAFTVPRNVTGHHAVIQGKVVAQDKDHCTEEAAEQTGSVAKVEIEASGVEFVD
jgi:Domain of unknown function (DUF4920)